MHRATRRYGFFGALMTAAFVVGALLIAVLLTPSPGASSGQRIDYTPASAVVADEPVSIWVGSATDSAIVVQVSPSRSSSPLASEISSVHLESGSQSRAGSFHEETQRSGKRIITVTFHVNGSSGTATVVIVTKHGTYRFVITLPGGSV